MLWLKMLVKLLVLPPNGPLLVVVAGLALAGRWPRLGRRVAVAGLLVLVLLSMPIVGAWMIERLDRTPPLDVTKATGAQAIVILGGGVRRYAAEYQGATISGLTLARVRYGARLARSTGLPILVSGGAARSLPAEAPLMRRVLIDEFGVPVRWVEARSRDTHENAANSAVMLKASGIARVILVGHSFDFPRIRKEFEDAGIGVIPAPINIPSTAEPSALDFMPSLGGMQLSYFATYEILANALYAMTH